MKPLLFSMFVSVVAASTARAGQFPMPLHEFLEEYEVSSAALEVLEDYRINGCEEHEGVRGYRPNIDYNPIFMMAADSYRMVELIENGVVAEFVQSSGMQCGDKHLEYCGSSGCQSHIIIEDMAYEIKGEPFLLVPEASYQGISKRELPIVIAWWGYGGSCHTQSDAETDPIQTTVASSCLLTTHYDQQIERLVFQHDYSQWPEELD